MTECLIIEARVVLRQCKTKGGVPTRRQKEAPKQSTRTFILSVPLYFIILLLGGGNIVSQPHDPLFYRGPFALAEAQKHMYSAAPAMPMQDITLQAFQWLPRVTA